MATPDLSPAALAAKRSASAKKAAATRAANKAKREAEAAAKVPSANGKQSKKPATAGPDPTAEASARDGLAASALAAPKAAKKKAAAAKDPSATATKGASSNGSTPKAPSNGRAESPSPTPKATARKKSQTTGSVLAQALVDEHDGTAPTKGKLVLDEDDDALDPGARITPDAFMADDDDDYDEPVPTSDDFNDVVAPSELDDRARALVIEALGGGKKAKQLAEPKDKKKKKKDKKVARKAKAAAEALIETDPAAPTAPTKAKAEAAEPDPNATDKFAEADALAAEKAAKTAKRAKAAKQEASGKEAAGKGKAPTRSYDIDRSKPDDAEGDDDAEGRPSFAELGLIEPLQRAVADMGFEYPTKIQERAIPPLLAEEDTDLVGLAQTGTGKTAAFGLPALHRLYVGTRVPQVLILAPTRELCLQITVEMGAFAKHMPQVDIAAVYGGADIVRQIKQIRRGVHVVVATPGRLRDLIRRRAIDLQHVRYLVLDEADEMLNMGFKEEIDDILESIPDEANTWLFSATMPEEVRRIAAEYMSDPIEVQSGERNAANVDIAHRFVITRPSERYAVLRRFLDYDPDMYGLTFVRTRNDAKELADALSADGYNADALHGDLSQAQRDNVMGRFRNRRLQVLVATDVAARGIDVIGITHVFHMNLPDDLSFYTHRSGRTARAGAEGISLALVHPKDQRKLRSIERIIKARFEEAEIPGGEQIIERRLMSNMRRLREVEPAEGLDAFLPAIEEALDGLSREDLIRRVASRRFQKLLNDYRFAPDLNDRRGREVAKRGDRNERDDRGRGDRDDRGGRDRGPRDDSNMARLFINVGGMDVGDRKGNLLAMLCDAGGINGTDVGRITMNRSHTFFDVDQSVAEQVVARLGELHFDGRPVRINPAEESEGSGRDDRGGDDRGSYGDGDGGKRYKKKFKGGGRRGGW